MTYTPRPLDPLPQPPADDAPALDVLEWAAQVHHIADQNLSRALANAYADPDIPVADIHARSPYSKVPTERRVRELGVPPRKPGGHR